MRLINPERIRYIDMATGQIHDNVTAGVHPDVMMVDGDTLPIKEGDIFERDRAGVTDRWEVIDPGFRDSKRLGKHFQAKTKKIPSSTPLQFGANDSNQEVKALPENRINHTNEVFIVHGRNTGIKKEIEHFLRAIGIKPLEWSKARELTGKPSPYTWEIVDAALQNAAAIIVLFTPDDNAQLREELLSEHDDQFEREPTGQPRPNVLFEAGVAYGRGADRTVIVSAGKIRPISDLAGHHMLRLNNSPETRIEFTKRLKAAGCRIDTDGASWISVGNFDLTGKPNPAPTIPPMPAATDDQTDWAGLHNLLLNAQTLMIARATGQDTPTDNYAQMRMELMKNSTIKNLLPEMLVRCRTLDEFWPVIRDAAGKYQERRDIIRKQFEQALNLAESHTN